MQPARFVPCFREIGLRLLVTRKEDLEPFDRIFDVYWRSKRLAEDSDEQMNPADMNAEPIQGTVTNLFDKSGIINPDQTVFTRRTSSSRGLKPFNPFTDTPIECPQGAAASVCTSMNDGTVSDTNTAE